MSITLSQIVIWNVNQETDIVKVKYLTEMLPMGSH
jgi:hypothetical protein